LAASIRARGVLQPVLVRAVVGGRYELIAGERRWRDATIAEREDRPRGPSGARTMPNRWSWR